MNDERNKIGGITPTPSQRSAAVDRAAENLALRSGAGCGKTLVLAMRFTQLLLNSPVSKNPLEDFVALTFTEKAAGEMLHRVRRMLTDMLQRAKKDDAPRIRRWIEELPDANISTIHGFCASLLRRFAAEAGVDPSFAICADELATARMQSDAADEALLGAVENRRDDVSELLADVTYDRAVGLVRNLLEQRTEWNPDQYADPQKILDNWSRMLSRARREAWDELDARADLREEMEKIESVPCSDDTDNLYRYRSEQLWAVGKILLERGARSAETFSMLNTTPGNIGGARAWGSREHAKSVRDMIKSLVADVGEYALYAEDLGPLDRQSAQILATLTRLAGRADEIYTSVKRAGGILDFTDLLYHTFRLLRDNPSVRNSLSKSFSQFLIDEAQDTDPFQISLLEALVLGDPDATEVPKGRLFLVGDAKQSIYRFRGVRVEVFGQLCRRLGRRAQQDLETSFRTHGRGIEFINYLFGGLMEDEYTPIKPKRSETPPQPSVEIVLARADDGEIQNAQHASSLQAAATAQRIADMLKNDQPLVWSERENRWRAPRPGDVAILLARMTNSADYERELAAREIPYYVVAGAGFFKQQEVYDVLNALAAIDNPGDDIAFFGVLRSGMFGLDDEALMSISQNVARPFLPSLGQMLERDGEGQSARTDIPHLDGQRLDTLTFAVKLLGELHRLKDTLGAGRIVNELLEATAYEGVLLAQFQGTQKAGNVRRVGELARQADASGLTLAEFVAQMNEQVVDQSRYEQAPVTGESEDVVRLMTIHKAKGLEFPVVIIPDLNAGRQNANDPLLNRPDWGLTYRHKVDANDDSPANNDAELPLSYRLSALAEQKDMHKEDIRRLYVAATRHRDHLVFVGADWRTKQGDFRSGGSYLAQLDEVLNISSASDAGERQIRCGRNGCDVSLCRIKVRPGRRSPRRQSRGDELLKRSSDGGELGRFILDGAAAEAECPPLLKTVPDPGPVRISATALSDFAWCPMFYRWKYELRAPVDMIPAGDGAPGPISSPLVGDAAAAGTIFHQYMSLIDFDYPPAAADLLKQAKSILSAEMPAAWNTENLAERMQTILDKFQSHPLWERIKNAKKIYRESDFLMRPSGAAGKAGEVTVTGRMDLLAQEAGGGWLVVDYKSDNIRPADAGVHAARYRLQMMIYAQAAEALANSQPPGADTSPPPEAMLYFLRPAEQYEFDITPQALDRAKEELRQLIERLKTARREGNFKTSDCPLCRPDRRREFCPYELLCEHSCDN